MHALFPGTFDPPTAGHMDLVERAARLFERLTVALAEHPTKQALFTVEERLELLQQCTSAWPNVLVRRHAGLVVDACRELGCDVIVRGVRSGSDFEYEAQMAGTNRMLLPQIDTLLLVTSPRFAHVRSTLVRQIAAMGGDASQLVPEPVARALRERASRARGSRG
jgi:pantetheine-phosphate adenylyltransferase